MGYFTGILLVFSYERSEPLAATLQDRSVVLPVIMASRSLVWLLFGFVLVVLTLLFD